MWRLSEIEIENIVSFHEAKLKITQGVATLIFGRNEDNAAQPCNGSGKSSLIEAISFALTGEQLRKVKSVEEIINDQADEAWVKITLENDYDNTVFVVERTISRGSSQVIECHKYDASGAEIEQDKTIQPTVLDYNRFILSEIGLTKDDIYNNYILCDNKYESFFDCSDKNKKEVINRFSNGQIIDESIARVQEDLEPVNSDLYIANQDMAKLNGSIAAINAELDQADVKKADAKLEREARIKSIEEKILSCREECEKYKALREKGVERLEDLTNVQLEIKELEDSDTTFVDSYHKVLQYCEKHSLGTITNFESLSDRYKDSLADHTENIDKIKRSLKTCQETLEQQKKEYEAEAKSYQANAALTKKYEESSEKKKQRIEKEIAKIDAQLDGIDKQVKDNKAKIKELESESMRIETLLSGVITCPKCKHQFILNHNESVEGLHAALERSKTEAESISDKNKKLNDEYEKLNDDACSKEDLLNDISEETKSHTKALEDQYVRVRALSKHVDDTERQISSLEKDEIAERNELSRIESKIDVLRQRLFGEIGGILEGRIANGKQYITQQDNAINFAEGQLQQYRQTKKELIETPITDFESSLKKSLDGYLKQRDELQTDIDKIQQKFNMLTEQVTNFTMFKSYIAKKKIEALSLIVNDFLEKIGSDIRLRLEGFTVTKTGKLRDKISVQVMRDGIDCGSYQKFSGGEKARLNLACILSLHTLTNNNCEDGKGLDFVIIDELLDKSDEVGMSTYCKALNDLKQTALLITQGGVAEGYPYKLLITKKQGVSSIAEE